MDMAFTGKVALIVGASSGMGRATAIGFAREGAKVVVAARRESEGSDVVREIHQLGGDAFFVRADVARESDVQQMVGDTEEKYGRLDFAVNCAGVEQHAGSLSTHSEAEWDRILGINARGIFFCMKHQVPAMLKNGGGAIVNISSIAAHVATPGAHIYAASKHAVLGLTRSAALEYASQGIRINEIAPGIIATPLIGRFAAGSEEVYEHLKSIHPIGRIGEPEEIASAAIWLCSPGAAFVIGHSLVIDGGLTIQ